MSDSMPSVVYAPAADTPPPPEIPSAAPPSQPTEPVAPPLPYPGDGLDGQG